jgi:predicted ferric reductase
MTERVMAQQSPKPSRVVEDPAAVLDAMLDRFSWSNVIGAVFLGLVVGLTVAWVVIPTYVAGIVASLQGDNPTAYWYICRAAGIVAYGLIWLSIVWGLLLTTNIGKQLGKVAPIVDLHRHISWLSVVFSLTHMLVLLLDTVVPYTVTLVFVPFTDGAYRPVAAALGQIGCYLLIFVTVSFWVRSWTGQKVWRAIHYISFAAYVMVMVHAIMAGTDKLALYWVYVGSAVVVVFLLMLRIIDAINERRQVA